MPAPDNLSHPSSVACARCTGLGRRCWFWTLTLLSHRCCQLISLRAAAPASQGWLHADRWPQLVCLGSASWMTLYPLGNFSYPAHCLLLSASFAWVQKSHLALRFLYPYSVPVLVLHQLRGGAQPGSSLTPHFTVSSTLAPMGGSPSEYRSWETSVSALPFDLHSSF